MQLPGCEDPVLLWAPGAWLPQAVCRQVLCHTSHTLSVSTLEPGHGETRLVLKSNNLQSPPGHVALTFIWEEQRGVEVKLRRKNEFKLKERASPGGSVVRNSPANAEDSGSIPDLGRSHTPRSNQVCAPQLLNLCSRPPRHRRSPRTLVAMLCNERRHLNEKARTAIRVASACRNCRKALTATKTPRSQKCIRKFKKINKNKINTENTSETCAPC